MLPTFDLWGRDCTSYDSTNCTAVDDWRYEMRREMQEILPGLYLGPFAACRNIQHLQNNGITHILCFLDSNELRIFKTDTLAELFNFKPITVSDSTMQNLIPIFPQCTAYIKEVLENHGKLLVCCNTGMSRSPSFVIAYAMEIYNMNATQAYQYVQSKRLCINPNDSFKSQLSEYEPIYMARKLSHPTDQSRRRRRSGGEDEDDMISQQMDSKRRQYTIESNSMYESSVSGFPVP
ncbi:hypothetical protein O0I10_007663 [Lichtheimia ornata]|uniref:Uncharacterized protein n=1 Tax=Lichtheimia ornata TaxID=688661 RepID=A0AAD7XXL6_9FUNG|nr:uncharacterized protein O0I10_007663 [Lichtheimia ornata]KAJ8656586.1 hypothetical protein O0I10_007663 [Lichtheimia ornata]